MTTLNLPLTDELRAIAETRAKERGCADIQEYVSPLIREDAGQDISPELEAELLKGLASPLREMTAADWDAMRAELRAEFPTDEK